MRVVLVVPTFPQVSETFIVSKFVGLRARGWDVHVACNASPDAGWQSARSEIDRDAVADRIHVGPPTRNRWRAARALPGVLLRTLRAEPRATLTYLARGLRRFGPVAVWYLYRDAHIVACRPDVVHVEFGALALDRLHLPELLGCRLTVSFRGHDISYVGLEDPHLYDALWPVLSGIHVLGDDLWARAVQRGARPDQPHVSIAPGVDVDRFATTRPEPGVVGSPSRPLRVLSVGRLSWTKGYEYALDAVRRARAAGCAVEYRIVGEGEYLEAICSWRHEAGLDEVVDLRGHVAHDGVLPLLAWADVLLHASVSEGFGNAVLEAQASGLPVVCSDAEGLAENVEDGVTGIVVARRDGPALADALVALARDPERRAAMGHAGSARAAARFALADQLDAIERFYRGVGSAPADARATGAAPVVRVAG